MKKLFGTDGIRGVANRDLTPELAFRVGRIMASLLKQKEDRPIVLIGRDTRLSGGMLEGSLSAGITSAGVSVRLLGIIPTPVSYTHLDVYKRQSSVGWIIPDRALRFFAAAALFFCFSSCSGQPVFPRARAEPG